MPFIKPVGMFGGGAATVEYEKVFDGGGSQSQNYGTINLGDPASDRVVIVFVTQVDDDYDNDDTKSVTLGGTTYDKSHSTYKYTNVGKNNDGYLPAVHQLWIIPYPSGTTANLSVSGSGDSSGVSVYTAKGSGSTDYEVYDDADGQYDDPISNQFTVDRKTLALVAVGYWGSFKDFDDFDITGVQVALDNINRGSDSAAHGYDIFDESASPITLGIGDYDEGYCMLLIGPKP